MAETRVVKFCISNISETDQVEISTWSVSEILLFRVFAWNCLLWLCPIRRPCAESKVNLLPGYKLATYFDLYGSICLYKHPTVKGVGARITDVYWWSRMLKPVLDRKFSVPSKITWTFPFFVENWVKTWNFGFNAHKRHPCAKRRLLVYWMSLPYHRLLIKLSHATLTH